MGQKVEIVKHYLALPPFERGRYIKDLGVTRSAVSYWKRRYIDGKTGEKKVKLGKVTPINIKEREYEVGNIEMSDAMRVLSVTVTDLVGHHSSQRVSAAAMLKCGTIADRSLAQLADKCIDVISGWGYKKPTSAMMRLHIKTLWR